MNNFWDLYIIDVNRWRERGECQLITKNKFHLLLNSLLFINPILAWLFWFRLCSFKKRGIAGFFTKFMYRKISWKCHIQISPKTIIGSGLYIYHGIDIIINRHTIIGNNCSISQFLTIGCKNGHPTIIKDNVYIAPNVSILGAVTIGNNAKIGAGCVVVKDIPDNATSVGNPNRNIINHK